MNVEKTYTLNEVEQITGITKRTLYNYLKADQFKAVKLGNQWRVTETELQRFLTDGVERGYSLKLDYVRPDRRKG